MINKFLNRIKLFTIFILSLWVIACTADPYGLRSEQVIIEIIDAEIARERLNGGKA